MEIINRGINHVTGITQEDGKTIVFETADLTANLDRVKRLREAEINHAMYGRCLYSLPLVAIAEFANRLGVTVDVVANDDKLLDKCAEEYSKFKVHGGVY